MRDHKIRVSSKGQVVIPEDMRKEYGITTGSELILKPLDENRLILEKVPKLSDLFGFLGKANAAKLLAKERETELVAERERDEELRRVLKRAK